jgi:hypothetical protein
MPSDMLTTDRDFLLLDSFSWKSTVPTELAAGQYVSETYTLDLR